jgi:hypothetical protein
LHDGKGLCFLFFLSHYLARPFKSKRIGWLDFLFLSHAKDSGVLFTFDDTLVFMIASWDGLIIRECDWGGYQINRLGWARSKDSFSFS